LAGLGKQIAKRANRDAPWRWRRSRGGIAWRRSDDVIHLEGEVVELTRRDRSRKGSPGSNGRRSISAASRSTRSTRLQSCRAAPS